MSADVGFFEGIVRDLTSGKGQLRLIVQPIVAIVLGARLGVADAREGKQPFLWRLFTGTGGRARLFKQSLSDVVLPLCMGIAIDSILQYLARGSVRVMQAVVVAFILVWLPYSCSRAITNRIARRRRAEPQAAA